jgi:hypothetical protein
MSTPRSRKVLALFPLALAPALLIPMTAWLRQQHDPHLLLGLGSSFWAGVLIGISIVCCLLSISFIVFLVLRARSSHAGHDDAPTSI